MKKIVSITLLVSLVALLLWQKSDRSKITRYLGAYPSGISDIQYATRIPPGIRHVDLILTGNISLADYTAFMQRIGAGVDTRPSSIMPNKGQPGWFKVPDTAEQSNRYTLFRKCSYDDLFIRAIWLTNRVYLMKEGPYGM